MTKSTLKLFAGVSVCFASVGLLAFQQAGTSSNWASYYGSRGNDHFSTLKQIDRTNVSKLEEVWRFDTHEAGGLETTPLILDGVMYALTPSQKVIALEGRTGKLLWTFDSKVIATGPNRGLTFWSEGSERRLLVGIMNFVYAIDPATGRPIETFGTAGRIDLREGLGREAKTQSIAVTTPGVIYKDLFIIGGRTPETLPAPPGDIRAFDVRTGAVRWSFHTLPHPGEPGYETWPKDGWKTGGAANNWAGMAVDAEHGIVFVPTGSAAPDFFGGDRLGDDLYANTLLALDAATGKRLWHFQGVHHDLWDRDFPAPPTLFTAHRNGKDIPAIAESTKQGVIFSFNRLTGEPLFPIEERPVEASTIPGEHASPKQPIPLKPAPFARQEITEATLTNRTPEAHRWAVDAFRSMRHVFPYDPFRLGQETLVMPSFEGGGEWGGMAVDPRTAVLYVNANDYASSGGLAAHAASDSGRSVYLAQCSTCHGENRAGSAGTFPSLIGIDKRLAPAQIEALVHQGRGRMPSFPNLQGAPLQRLLTYLRTGEDIADPGSGEADLAHAATVSTTVSNPEGAAIYAKNCAMCHGDQMQGMGTTFPSLKGVTARLKDEQILERIHQGKGPMPAFTKFTPDDEKKLMLHLHGDIVPPAPRVQYTMTGYKRFLDPDGFPAVTPPWGTLSAIDMNTGEYLWKVPLGEYPALAAKGMTNTGSENYGGPLVTAGGLVFIAATNFDHRMRALDDRDGKLLWQTTLPFAGNATPATYAVQGRQYVVIASGGSSLMIAKGAQGGVYVAYALKEK